MPCPFGAPDDKPGVSLAAFIQIIVSITRATVLSTVALVLQKNIFWLLYTIYDAIYHLSPVIKINPMHTGATTRQIQSQTVYIGKASLPLSSANGHITFKKAAQPSTFSVIPALTMSLHATFKSPIPNGRAARALTPSARWGRGSRPSWTHRMCWYSRG